MPLSTASSACLALVALLLSTAAAAQTRAGDALSFDQPRAVAATGAASTPVIEYYNAAQDHYFVTADVDEIADLDRGVHAGWRRTGASLNAYAKGAARGNPVCRFYIPPALGDSHFYSASPSECAETQAKFPGFVAESTDVFELALPEPTTGACPAATAPIYRVWNQRVDTNHRYTADRTIRQQMSNAGWLAEGYGSDQVVMCSPTAPSMATVDVAVAGRAVIKARAGGNVVALLEERLTSIFEAGPQRTLVQLLPDGRGVRPYATPAGWSVLDFAVHASGGVSVLLATDKAIRVVRLDADGAVRSDQPFIDGAAAVDPYYAYEATPKDDTSLQPVLMHDAARVVPLGESLVVVLRTGRNAVVAYRLDLDDEGAYRRRWRTLVEPGSAIAGRFLISGSFDTFGALMNYVGIHVDATPAGVVAVALVELPFHDFVFDAHATYFGEPIAAQAGVLVTRLAGDDGRRLGTTVIDTGHEAEVHALRAAPDGFALVGRVRSEVRPDGSGWDAFLATVATDGSASSYRVLDVDRGDVLFDVAPLPGGRFLGLGTTDYVQNPSGASISEDTQPLLALLSVDAALVQRIGFTDGPRQDQLRTITSLNGRWLVGGLRNGPGTHSGDGRPEAITADGYLSEAPDLPRE
jgi:hypothetical protein